MNEELVQEESSHYEISLTAAQAFIAFVLLLLSLAAAFAFGLIVGKGQGGEDRLVVRREPVRVNESAVTPAGKSRIVELGVDETTGAEAGSVAGTEIDPVATEPAPGGTAGSVGGEGGSGSHESSSEPAAGAVAPAAGEETHFVQLLSSSDAKSAETLAATLIDHGYKTAFVERVPSDGGMIYRVRVKFPSEGAARASVGDLKAFGNGEVWVTK